MEILDLIWRILVLVFCVVFVIIVAYLVPFLISIRPRRPKESGFRYVYVENDGSAREVTRDEMEYLDTDFEGGDGGRPYVKAYYGSLTPDWKMHGYLRRRQLPKSVEIKSAPDDDLVT